MVTGPLRLLHRPDWQVPTAKKDLFFDSIPIQPLKYSMTGGENQMTAHSIEEIGFNCLGRKKYMSYAIDVNSNELYHIMPAL